MYKPDVRVPTENAKKLIYIKAYIEDENIKTYHPFSFFFHFFYL